MRMVEPVPALALDVHGAAQRLDRPLDHVHADAAPGDAGDRPGGGEAGQEDQGEQLLVGEPGLGVDEPALQGLGPDGVRVEPGPVVGISMRRWRRSGQAESRTVPRGGLPAAARASGPSMPWSQLLRMRWTSGSPSRSMTVLSSSVSAPSVTRSISLPSSAERSCTSRLNRLKVVPMGTHADVQGRVAQLGGEALHVLGDRQQVGGLEPRGDLRQPGLGDDQLAHQVHQPVELGRPHAEGGAGLDGRCLPGLGPARRGPLRGRPGHGRGGRLTGAGRGIAERLHRELAPVLDEDEDVADRLGALVGRQQQLPAQVAALRRQLLQRGELLGLGRDPAGAERAQLGEQAERVGAVLEEVAVRLEPDPPAARHLRGDRCRGRCRWPGAGCRGGPGQERPQRRHQPRLVRPRRLTRPIEQGADQVLRTPAPAPPAPG